MKTDDISSATLPCCIQIEMRTRGSIIQNTLGPLTCKQAEDLLRQSGFVQVRSNLWVQDVGMTMDYCGTKIHLKDAHAWVHLLLTPEQVSLAKS